MIPGFDKDELRLDVQSLSHHASHVIHREPCISDPAGVLRTLKGCIYPKNEFGYIRSNEPPDMVYLIKYIGLSTDAISNLILELQIALNELRERGID